MADHRAAGSLPGGGGRPVTIGLLWHSATSGNLGVGALTLANIAIIREICGQLNLTPRFHIIGMRDGDSPPIVGDDVAISVVDWKFLLSPAGYWRLLRGLDYLMDIGAGDSFAEIYGPKRFAMLWLSKALAVVRGVPLLLSPQTIGPFTRVPYVQLAGWIMNRAQAVVARDAASLELVRRIAPRAAAKLSTDVAFGLPYADQSGQRNGGGGNDTTRLRVGINTSGLLYTQAHNGQNRFGLSIDYARFTHALIEALLARGDVDVLLITHAISGNDPADDDSFRADQLAAAYPEAIRVANFPSPIDAKSCISGLDLLISGRMHACIGAYSSGTPVVPVAYSRKFSGVFGLYGYDALIPVQGMTTEEAVAFVLAALDRREDLARMAASGMAAVQQHLDAYRAVLTDMMAPPVTSP